jgi:glycosyltransferase involved in cell wall biosynthesis
MLAALLTRRTCVTHERGINDRYPRAARFFGRRLAAIICISEAVRENMRCRGADFGNLLTIHNGLDPEALKVHTCSGQLRAMWQLPPAAPVLVMTGNIKSWKGQDTLVRAVNVIRRQFPEVRCLLVGDTSPDDMDYEITLKALIADLRLEDHVVFAGFQRNVADFLSLSDVVVHASVLPEPFGRVLLEAMACRKPIVAARGGAVPEIVEEGSTGLTFPPGDAEGLARAVIRLLEHPEEARGMGERGYRRLIERFDIRRNLDATQNLYDRLSEAH